MSSDKCNPHPKTSLLPLFKCLATNHVISLTLFFTFLEFSVSGIIVCSCLCLPSFLQHNASVAFIGSSLLFVDEYPNPSCGHPTTPLSTPSGQLGYFRVLVTVNKTTRNIQVQILCGYCLQRSGTARSAGKHMFKLRRSRQAFSKVTVQLCISISLCQRSSCLTALVRSVFSILAILTGVVESH